MQSLFESEDLIREAHRSQITDLSKKYHSLTIRTSLKKVYCHHQQDTWKHVRDLSWPVHEVCKKLPALGVYNQDVFDSYPQELTTKDSTHLQSVQRACTKNRVANDTVLDLTKPQFLSNSDNKQSFVDLNLALKLANIPDHRHISFGCSRKLEMCNRGGRRYRSYSPTTSQHEGHGAEHSPTVLPHQEVALGHRSSCCMCKIKAINETHSQFLLGVWMQHDLQDIYEGQKKFFGIPEADTEYWRSVTLFEDSHVPKQSCFCYCRTPETSLLSCSRFKLSPSIPPGAATWIQASARPTPLRRGLSQGKIQKPPPLINLGGPRPPLTKIQGGLKLLCA